MVLGRLSRITLIALAVTALCVAVPLIAFDAVAALHDNDRELIILMFAGWGLVLVAVPLRVAAITLGAFVALWLLAALAYTQVPGHVYIPTPVNSAVGASAFFGTGYLASQYAAALLQLLALAGVAAWGAWAAKRGWPAASEEAAAEELTADEPPPRARWLGPGAVVLLVGLLLLSLFPNLRDSTLSAALSPPPKEAWDLQNFLVWSWLVSDTGTVPMRDYFWPYGTTWLFSEFPLGQLWTWVGRAMFVPLIAWSLWRLAPVRGRVVKVALCLATIPFIQLWAGTFWRYGIPLVVLMVYAALRPAQRDRPTRDQWIMVAALLYLGFYELDFVIPVIFGAGFMLIADLATGRVTRTPRLLLRRVTVDALPLLALLAVPLFWVLYGGAEGWVRFYAELRGTSAQGASELRFSALAHFVGVRPTAGMLYLVAPVLTLTAGLVLHAFGGPRAINPSRLLLAGAAASFAVTLKHIVRYQGELPLLAPIVAGLWAAILLWSGRRLVLAAAVGLYFGIAAVALDRGDMFGHYWRDYVSGSPSRVVDSFDLVGEGRRIDAINDRRFVREYFPDDQWPREESQATMLAAAMEGKPDHSFAVLGDAPILYAWFKQVPPFHLELYDASRVSEQEEMVEHLEDEKPAFAFWRRDFGQDGVPQAVRVPIVFRYFVDHYAHVTTSTDGDVLRRLKPGEPIDAGYWLDRLTTTFGVGFVSASSTADDAWPCQDGDGCASYAMLRGHADAIGDRSFRIEADNGMAFQVVVSARPEEDEYPVRLDRLWFWGLIKDAELTFKAEQPGWTVAVEGRGTGDALW